ncbi:ketosynthase [Solilutibacter pythonis]|uniref:ketosynthase n=1 Tax=Solilutibacter pythonis TaxID=2483112 RepID=UPI001314D91C|nr:ketosynthase [Lysobacter pythonis]
MDAWWLRPLLVLVYLLLAHFSAILGLVWLNALALLVIVMLLLLPGLSARRAWAWLALAAAAVLLAQAGRVSAGWLGIGPLLVPVVFVGLFGGLFARTLRRGQVPLITRIVAAMERVPASELSPELYRYSRGLTIVWTCVLALLALVNLGLALVAERVGLLARLDVAVPWTVSEAQWSWFANGFNYGLVGLVFVFEYAYRARRFPGRYKSPLDFARRMAALGPDTWRELLK